MLLLRCPHCRNTQNYMPSKHSQTISGKRRRCVYCGKTFKVSDNIISRK